MSVRNLKYRKKHNTEGGFYTDIHRDFLLTLKQDIQLVKDAKQIEQSISGIILTRKGECPLDPEFGCNLQNQLFENLNSGTAYMVSQSILEAIEKYEPRVENVKVNQQAIYDTNTLIVTIQYFIKSVNEEQVLEYELAQN